MTAATICFLLVHLTQHWSLGVKDYEYLHICPWIIHDSHTLQGPADQNVRLHSLALRLFPAHADSEYP